jgi:maltose phosphorylase
MGFIVESSRLMNPAHLTPDFDLAPWAVIERGWDSARGERAESVFAIGNGHFGQRANFEESYSGPSLCGSYIAGVYYPDKTRVGWWKNGYPESFAKVLNSTNWIGVRIMVNGEEVDLHHVEVHSFERVLDMRRGLLQRRVELTTAGGVRLSLETERFCAMHESEQAAVKVEVELLESAAEVELIPFLDADVRNQDSNWDDAFWSIDDVYVNRQGWAVSKSTTNKSGFGVAFAMEAHATVSGTYIHPTDATVRKHRGQVHFKRKLEAGERFTCLKYVGIVSSLNYDEHELIPRAQHVALLASKTSYLPLRAGHEAAWESIWKAGDITIAGDEAAQQAIRFNVFHLNQTYRGDDPRLNIGPKGFTGEKYGGASYWDTEAYCLPFFLASHPPKVAKQLLKYRHNHLEKAIENAGKLGFKDGAALYPMVTMNGEECHNEWEITFEEIHRNGAMAFAIFNYTRFTGDNSYERGEGYDVLQAIARFWAQRVNWSEERHGFVLLGVTGPNEYENNVNNNWYTNYLAKWCLEYAAEVGAEVRKADVDAEERKSWLAIADQLVLPQLEGSDVFLQQDGFMDKVQAQAADIPLDECPINQHWSWDRILRSIYIKQADVLQGLYLFEDRFSEHVIAQNFDFYEPKTVHESSLSPCVHSVLAAKIGRVEKAYELYLRTARLDLDDYNHEVHEGLHITSMAGTWISVVEGFGGFRVVSGFPHFNPCLPQAWNELSFSVLYRGRHLFVRVLEGETEVRLLYGEPIVVYVHGAERPLVPYRA